MLERCTVCGGPLNPLCICSHCNISHPAETYSSGRAWICPSCNETLPIQFACRNCGTRYLYEEAVKERAEGVTPPIEEAPQPPKQPEKPVRKRPLRRLKGEYDENDVREIARLPGINSKRAELLCKAGFNSVSKIKSASQEDLSAVPGIGPELAKGIKSTTNLILLLPRRRSKEDLFEEERECPKCGLPAPVFSEKCLECGSAFEAEVLDERTRREVEQLGVDALVEYYGRILYRISDDPQLWFALGLALNSAGRIDAARKAVRKAKKLDPENPKLLELEGSLGRKAKAIRVKEKEAQQVEPVIEPLPQIPEKPTEIPIAKIESPEKSALVAEPTVSKLPEGLPEKTVDTTADKRAVVSGIEALEKLKRIAESESKSSEKEQPQPTQAPPVEEVAQRAGEVAAKQPEPPSSQAIEWVLIESDADVERQQEVMVAKTSHVAVPPGRRPLLTSYGLVNGRGRVNGLINGNGFVNGGTISEVTLPRANMIHRYAAVAAFLLAIFLIVNTSLQLRVPTAKSIQIDGNFEDWQSVGTYHDASSSSNPDTNLVSYALKLEGQSLFFMARVEGMLFGDTIGYDSFYIFFDVDADNSTGYSCGALGAEDAVMVDGYNSTSTGASLQTFSGQDRSNWNDWASAGAVNIAVSDNRIEGEVQTSAMPLMDSGGVLAIFVVDDQDGHVSQSAVAIGVDYGVLKVTQRGLTETLATGPTDFLELTFEVIGSPVTLASSDIVISHTANTQLNGIPTSMTVTEGNRRIITISMDASVIATGDVVQASLSSVTANRPVTIAGGCARAYVLSPPTGKRVDGLFAEWQSPHIDTVEQPAVDPGDDIEAHDANASGETVYLYFRTVTDSFGGSLTPKHQQRTLSSPSAGGGGSHPQPRLTGESVARVYLELDPTGQDGFPIGGLLAEYMVEAKGQFGSIRSISIYQWQGRWVIATGALNIALMANQVELSASLAGLDLTNASYVIETRNWRNFGDVTSASGTRGRSDYGTRGTYVVLMGTYTHLYALPTSNPPQIDGQYSDSEWAGADSYSSNDIAVYTLQDGTKLYLAIRVKSDTSYNPGDYAEIAFDTDDGDESAPQSEDKKFSATDPDGSAIPEDFNGDGADWDSLYESPFTWYENGAKDSDDNYITYEFAIPFQEVWNTPTPYAGQPAGLAVHVHDADSNSDYYWGWNNLKDLANFGTLEIPEYGEFTFIVIMILVIVMVLLRRPGKNNKPRGH